ncbi:hypothetical protein KFK09_006971 [Dendrobium nobile]|uniref:HAT C-terminal dimerisation domain-containing protein n=1 Tax=Dendrobium nobile TaxID=94219 RepID=A0A8T3BQP6_DENNO|nr:hypothetical protein KFK09_006971 [Dendrobium nobile]
MEDIFKIQKLRRCFEKAVAVHSFIYSRPRLLELMRRCTNQRALVKLAKTRFATAFLTLQRFHQQQLNLKKMFTCEEFILGPYAKEAKAKQSQHTILQQSFWNTIVYALKIAGPLLKVLRLVDGEKKPPMAYIYEAIDRAKEAIAASFNNSDKYDQIFKMIDRRWEVQLYRPLHAAGHFLNPEYFFNNPDIAKDKEIADDLYQCIGRLSQDVAEEDKISNELSLYIRGEGLFGIPPAVRQRTTRSPADWWLAYGQGAPNLQSFAIKVLSLTCSSSGCERNWSIFEHLHSKRRSKLDHGRLKDLVYVKYNRALIRRFNHRDVIDPISLTEIDDANEWLTGKLDDESDEENDFIVGEEDLTWTSVAKATGVYDKSYNIRERSKGKEKESSIRHDVAIENDDEEGDEEDYEVGDNVEEDNEAFLTFADDDDDSQEE